MIYLNPGLNEGEFVAVIHELRDLLSISEWELFEVYVNDDQWNSLADGLYDGINNRTKGRYIIRYIPMVPVTETVEIEVQPEPITDPDPWAEYYPKEDTK